MKRSSKTCISIGIFLIGISVNAQDAAEVKHLLDNERYSSAEAILEKKISEGQAGPELNYLMVRTYVEQEKLTDVKKFIDQQNLAGADMEDPMNRIAYGSYLLSGGHQEAAMAIFNSILEDKKNARNPSLLIAVAEAHISAERGNMQEAISLLNAAGKRERNNAEIDILKGNAYRKLMDGNNAFLSYQSALQKDPASVKAHYFTGKIFVTQKNTDVYMDHFLKAYAIDSTYAPVLDALYDHYYFRDVKQAMNYLKKYMLHSDYSIANDYRMTDLLYLSRDYDAAVALAQSILEKETKVQPRLYKLIAYSLAAKGDSSGATTHLENYFSREEAARIIAPDYEFRGRLTERIPGSELNAITYYEKAVELDSVAEKQVGYAGRIAKLYKEAKDYSSQAKWLRFVYEKKEGRSNLDLFHWGVAHYNAQEYALSDSVFVKYTSDYPENIYGYFWRAQVNAAVDTSLTLGLAVPHYERMIEIGEKNQHANKAMLLKAYAYLGGYEANTTKNYQKSLGWFRKYNEMDASNGDISRYIGLLEKWIKDGK